MARKRYTIVKREFAPGGWTIKDHQMGKNLDDYAGNYLESYSTFTRAEALDWARDMNEHEPERERLRTALRARLTPTEQEVAHGQLADHGDKTA